MIHLWLIFRQSLGKIKKKKSQFSGLFPEEYEKKKKTTKTTKPK